MVIWILVLLGLGALNSFIHGIKHAHKFWSGEGAGVEFVFFLVYSLLFVFEAKAFMWLWQLDDRFDLPALAASAGI